MNDKPVFVMAGFVIEGQVETGMAVRLPLQAGVVMTAGIDQVQHLRRPDGDVVCLCLACREPGELALWDALKLKDRIIDIVKAGALV